MGAPVARDRLHNVTLIAQHILGGVKVMLEVAFLGGAMLWTVLLIPFVITWWTVLAAIGLLFALLLPAFAVGLFYLGLKQLLAMPSELVGSLTETRANASALVQGARGKEVVGEAGKMNLVTAVLAMGRSMLECRGLVVGAAGLMRLANPITMVVVLCAMALGPLEALAALGVGILRILW